MTGYQGKSSFQNNEIHTFYKEVSSTVVNRGHIKPKRNPNITDLFFNTSKFLILVTLLTLTTASTTYQP